MALWPPGELLPPTAEVEEMDASALRHLLRKMRVGSQGRTSEEALRQLVLEHLEQLRASGVGTRVARRGEDKASADKEPPRSKVPSTPLAGRYGSGISVVQDVYEEARNQLRAEQRKRQEARSKVEGGDDLPPLEPDPDCAEDAPRERDAGDEDSDDSMPPVEEFQVASSASEDQTSFTEAPIARPRTARPGDGQSGPGGSPSRATGTARSLAERLEEAARQQGAGSDDDLPEPSVGDGGSSDSRDSMPPIPRQTAERQERGEPSERGAAERQEGEAEREPEGKAAATGHRWRGSVSRGSRQDEAAGEPDKDLDEDSDHGQRKEVLRKELEAETARKRRRAQTELQWSGEVPLPGEGQEEETCDDTDPYDGQAPDTRPPHVQVVVLGHEGAGKSALFGAMLHAAGAWDARDVARYRRECGSGSVSQCDALEASGLSLRLADVPGSRESLLQAVDAAAEADVALLVVSAQGQEFEKACDSAGSLVEHVRIVGGLGVRTVTVVVNKLGDGGASEKRFDEIRSRMRLLASEVGLASSALGFVQIKAREDAAPGRAPWAAGQVLLDRLRTVAPTADPVVGTPLRVHVFEAKRCLGRCLRVSGRVERGLVAPGLRCFTAPARGPCQLDAVSVAGRAVASAGAGEAVELQLSQLVGGALAELPRGAVLSSGAAPVRAARHCRARLRLLEAQRPVTAGLRAMLHVHCASSDCELIEVQGPPSAGGAPRALRAGEQATVVFELDYALPMDPMGRSACFLLRSNGRTMGVGRVLEVTEDQEE